MYMLAFMLLLLVLVYAISAGVPVLKTRLFETVLFSVYNVWTFVGFFKKTRWWKVIILSIINMVINYFAYVYIMEWVVLEKLTE